MTYLQWVWDLYPTKTY